MAPKRYLFNGTVGVKTSFFRSQVAIFFLVKNRFLGPKFHVIGGRKNTHTHTSRWWFQIFFIFTPNLGEDEPNLTCAYFSDGWEKNHQPDILPGDLLIISVVPMPPL